MNLVPENLRAESAMVDMSQIEQLKSLRFRAPEAPPPPDLPQQRGRLLWSAGGLFAAGVAFTASAFLLFGHHSTQQAAAPAAGPASSLVASGFVVARRQATIASEVTGRLTRLAVEEGQQVGRGQLLAELDANTADAALANSLAAARSAQADVAGREALKADAARDLARNAALAERGFATKAALQTKQAAYQVANSNLNAAVANSSAALAAVASARSIRSKYRIVAPFGGVVVSTNAEVGEIISPISAGGGFTRTGICTIVDMTSLEVEATVGEALIGRVQPGQKVTAVLDAYPDLAIPARVIAIIPAADRDRGSIRVRVALLKSDARILPDMAVKVSFEQPTRGKP
jgi:RND family efflux transporter MFP subunit